MAVADLSQSAAKARTPVPEAADLGQDNAEQAGIPGSKAEVEVIPVRAAFMIVLMMDGQVGLISDISAPVIPQREASGDEIYGALHTAAHKLSSGSIAGQTAGQVVGAMQNAGRVMADAQMNAQVKAKLQWEHDHPGKTYPGTPVPPGAVPNGFKPRR